MERKFLVWDWWRVGSIYYAIMEEDGILYFSVAPILNNFKG